MQRIYNKGLFVFVIMYCSPGIKNGFSQDRYSAVNPALFTYTPRDVYIQQPQKYNNGRQLISPDPQRYPWEGRLENGMPNTLVAPNGDISIYISSFLIFSPTPPSKVGVMVYSNTSNSLDNWRRPNTELYWYNSSGTTADEKILSNPTAQTIPTNIVAVDLESMGIYDDSASTKPVKLIYMPQREFFYKYLGAYEGERNFTADGVLSVFSDMKQNRRANQKVFTFKNINADTHMNWMKRNGIYSFTSRVNSRRSALKKGEVPPFEKDPRKRYRRSTITEVGRKIENKNTTFDVVLDYPVKEWEPYGMQPFRLSGFDKDVWFGLVTVYGVEGYPLTEKKQRTELAISNNGKDWRYLKPGVPFLDNGAEPRADDFGCINISTPISNTRFHGGRNPNDPFFFYASSNIKHEEGRNPGISLAISKYGKIAGLSAGMEEKTFYSVSPMVTPIAIGEMIQFSVPKAFALAAEFYPYILADITQDPRIISTPDSYVKVKLYAYNPGAKNGLGHYLGGCMGSSQQGSGIVSDNYESIGIPDGSSDGKSKNYLLRYVKSLSDASPRKIFSIKEMKGIPVILQASVKNAKFYGVEFRTKGNNNSIVNLEKANNYAPLNVWTFKPVQPVLRDCYKEDFSTNLVIPNAVKPTQRETGSIAVKIRPQNQPYEQIIYKMYDDPENYLTLSYTDDGNIRYRLVKENTDFLDMNIAPPTPRAFENEDVTITIEAVEHTKRKYDPSFTEETTVFRVNCPSLHFEKILRQRIIWNWRHSVPNSVDSAYARGFAHLAFSNFVGHMNQIVVGGNETCANKFTGSIYQIQISGALPKGASDFCSNKALGNETVNSKNRKRITTK